MYISSYIDNYEVSNKEPGRVSVRATCHRPLRKSEKPYDLRIILDGSTPVQLCEAVCSCVAGKLYQAAHYSQLHLSAVPPVLSCTETEQCWHKPRTMGVKPGRVRDMVVMAAKPKQRTVGGGVRSTLYKAVKGELPDPNVLRVAEVYADFAAELAPLITTLAISPDIPLIDSALGKVQEGSLIAMQHPVVVSRCIQYHPDAPPPPPLPLADYRLEPTTCQFVCSLQEQLHLVSLQTSWEAARQVEASTRDQSLSAEWYRVRSQRVTSSHFKEVCHIRENPPFGLVEIKCPNAKSYVDCKYLRSNGNTMSLKRQHAYYWQVQGQLLVTGMEWCDFVVFAEDDMT
ncbi:hypothetical protein AALO_G00171700 [Alosa alosa]|uniref:YqaJ viral recombinase domain-containing protein n=1 Tax=Alosa alosa TaxID=278164 RepID=A0AAV6GCZ3_9TELE|nr:hypothetical protein AALO_G00171700 [Alosa alosa]